MMQAQNIYNFYLKYFTGKKKTMYMKNYSRQILEKMNTS